MSRLYLIVLQSGLRAVIQVAGSVPLKSQAREAWFGVGLLALTVKGSSQLMIHGLALNLNSPH
jgi:hypothetical protein